MNPWALAGLLLLIPLILLYLLKPKPKHVKFPTIMFITRAEKDKRFRFFPKRFIRDPLLLIQIMIIILLVLAIANPYIMTKAEEGVAEDIVFVIDSSASMQATDVTPSRFEKAKETVANILNYASDDTKISMVLAENTPIVVLRNSDRENAKSVLNLIECSDTPSDIGDAIIFAKEMLSSTEGNKEIYVLSDFSNSEGMDMKLASKLVEESGIDVKFVDINKNGGNIGIVNIEGDRFLTNRERFYLIFTVRNYYSEDKIVSMDILLDDNVINSIEETIPANSEKLFHIEDSISSDAHVLAVRINNEDPLLVDNNAFLSIREIQKYKLLLITNDHSDEFLQYALESSPDISLTVAVTPVIPEFNGFDTVIHGRIDRDILLEGMYDDLEEYLQTGGNLIILPYPDLMNIQNQDNTLEELMPVKLEWLRSSEKTIQINRNHEIFKDVSSDDIIVKQYYTNTVKNNSVVVAETANEALIAYHRYGQGDVVYEGLNPNPEWSNFYYSSSMPIFWFNLITWINRKETEIPITNLKTGDYLPLTIETNVTTPSGKSLHGKSIILNEIGTYSVKTKTESEIIAVNLADNEESDIRQVINVDSIVDSNFNIKRGKIDIRQELYPYIMAVVIILLLIELTYYRKRGYFA